MLTPGEITNNLVGDILRALDALPPHMDAASVLIEADKRFAKRDDEGEIARQRAIELIGYAFANAERSETVEPDDVFVKALNALRNNDVKQAA